MAVLIVSTHERKVPKVLQKINKALGLPKKSEVLWDILMIANNTNEITDLKEKVDQLEECCNCTKSSKYILLFKSEKPMKFSSYYCYKANLAVIGWNFLNVEILLASQKLVTVFFIFANCIIQLHPRSIQISISEQVLLIATGRKSSGGYPSAYSNQSQVMNLNSPNTCTNIAPFPDAINGGAGGVLNRYPLICGGFGKRTKLLTNFWKRHLKRQKVKWSKLQTVLRKCKLVPFIYLESR